SRLGRRSALAQVALKLTAPGIPDIYQGDELEYRALVDPDNRQPVDWELRQELLRGVSGITRPSGAILKLYLTVRLLALRAQIPVAFGAGYEPLDAGAAGCAFLRGGDVMTLVQLPRAGISEESTLRGAPAG